MAIDFSKLKASLISLEVQLENHEQAATRPELSLLDREAIRDSAVKRFEVAFEMSWKHLKRYLLEELGRADTPNSPKPVLRLAAENNLISNRIEAWLAYADARVTTSHDYSGTKAAETLRIARPFLGDAIALYKVMTGDGWP